MSYEYILLVNEVESGEIVAEIIKPNLEMLEEQFRGVEEKVAKWEADKRIEEQEELANEVGREKEEE